MSQMYVDNIDEKTADNGVNIDGVIIKDNLLSGVATPISSGDGANKGYVDTKAETFIGLTDTPSSFSGESGKFPRVNGAEDALEFVAGTTANHAGTHFFGSGDMIDLAKLKPSGDVDMDSNKIINVTDPTSDQHAATKKYVDDNAGAGSPWRYINIPAGAWDYPASGDVAPLDKISGNDGELNVQRMDDTVKEYVIKDFRIPDDFDATGTVWFYPEGVAITAAADKDIVLGIAHSSRASGEDWDVPYVSGDMDVQRLPNTQGLLHQFSFSSGATALGWAANDIVRLKQYRNPEHASDNLVGDYGFVGLMIKIPRA